MWTKDEMFSGALSSLPYFVLAWIYAAYIDDQRNGFLKALGALFAARAWLARYLCGRPTASAPSPLDLEIEAAAGNEDEQFDRAVLFHRVRST